MEYLAESLGEARMSPSPLPDSSSDSDQALATDRSAGSDWTTAFAVALVALAVYLAIVGLHIQSIDEIMTLSVARSLAGHGSFDVDSLTWVRPLNAGVAPGIDGHMYTPKDVGLAILVTPMMWLAHQIGVSAVQFAFLLGPLLTASTVALLYLTIRAGGYSPGVAVLGALAFGLTSMAVPYSKSLFTQPLAAFGLLLAIYGVTQVRAGSGWRGGLIGGLGAGIAGVSAVPTWAVLPLYLLYLMPWESLANRSWRLSLRQGAPLIVAFGASAGCIVVFQLWYNAARFGAPLETGYQMQNMATLSLAYFGVGSFGQLFSFQRGLVWFAPMVVLAPIGLWIGWRLKRLRMLLLPLGQIIVIFCLYSSYNLWWAGGSYGPRYLTVLMPAVTLLIVPLFERILQPAAWRARLAVGLILLISASVVMLSSLFDIYKLDQPTYNSLIAMSPAPDWPTALSTLTDSKYLLYPRQFRYVRAGYWDVPWMAGGQPDWPYLGLHILLIVLAISFLFAIWRRLDRRLVRGGLMLIVVLNASFMLLMLTHYPRNIGYSLPNRVPPQPDLDALTTTLSSRATRGDGLVTVLPMNSIDWLDRYDSTVPDTGLTLESPLRKETIFSLKNVRGWYDRVWLVTALTAGGNPDNGVEQWIASQGFAGMETSFGDYRLVPYTFSSQTTPLRLIHQRFGSGEIELIGETLQSVNEPRRRWLDVTLQWQALAHVDNNFTVFIHVINSNGAIVSQTDGWPVAGYAPTSGWNVGHAVDDRHYVELPLQVPGGVYQVMVGLYDAQTGQRLTLANQSGTAVTIEQLRLSGAP